MYIPSKHPKHGIKIWVAADPTTMYTCNAKVYLGKNGNTEKDLGEKVFLHFDHFYKLLGCERACR